MAACPRCPWEAGVGVDASYLNQQTRTNLAASDNSNRAGERRQFSFLVNCSPGSTIRTRVSQRNHDADTVKPFLTRCGRAASPSTSSRRTPGPIPSVFVMRKAPVNLGKADVDQ